MLYQIIGVNFSPQSLKHQSVFILLYLAQYPTT
jgi:hypothetical protein